MKIAIIILSTIIILGLLGIYYRIAYSRLQRNKIKVDEAENKINSYLKDRYDYVVRTSHLVKKNLDLDIELFKEIENMKAKKVSNVDLDNKINDAYATIVQLKEDYPKLEGNRGFKDIIADFNESNEKLEATKAFFDKYAVTLNHLLSRFPSNIIGRIHKMHKVDYYSTTSTDNDMID